MAVPLKVTVTTGFAGSFEAIDREPVTVPGELGAVNVRGRMQDCCGLTCRVHPFCQVNVGLGVTVV